jgi:hypothetical protein
MMSSPSHRRSVYAVAASLTALAVATVLSACTDVQPTAPGPRAADAASLSRVPVAPLGSLVTKPSCPISYGAADNAKPNKVYLYFPTADDATYPEFGFGFPLVTSPAHHFDASELPSYTGTTADLRDGVTNVVIDTYCEFNVQVRQTTTAPPTTFARRNTVAIGTDAQGSCGGETWGLAQAVDVGDPTAVDFAREWAGSYNCAGGPGGQLNGANSTLVRWSKAIGGTAAHEAGHNYGLSHSDGLVLGAGEDPLVHHVMASGSHYSYADRAGYRRHFSDHEYSVLAANVGLSIQTMWNWDLVNPNAEVGRKLQMDFLSKKPSLILSWAYAGNTSPWINPTVSGPLGSTTFKGQTYNKYRLEWSTGHAWVNGPSGRVPGGAEFHVGATFSGVDFNAPDAIIITDTRLIDSTGTTLALHPRLPGFDAGTVNTTSGFLDLHIFNVDLRPLILQHINWTQLPRVMALEQMNPQGRFIDPMGQAFTPWADGQGGARDGITLKEGQEIAVPIASLSQKPHVSEIVTARDCALQDRLKGVDVAKCNTGTSTDLFPSTTLYITAEAVDPSMKHWDPLKKAYVVGPVTTRTFYQVAGRRRSDKTLLR